MWIGTGVGQSVLPASSKLLVGSLTAAALALRPFTILRTHLQVDIRSDQETAIEHLIASLGIIVVTETAAAIGVTAVPDPSGISGDPDSDWFLWTALANSFFIDINGTDGIGVSTLLNRYTLDSKAMRKVGPEDTEVIMLSNDTAVGASVTTQGRQLVQLH